MSSSDVAAPAVRSSTVRLVVAWLGAVAAVGAAVRAGLHFEAVLAAAFVGVLAVATVVDLEERRVPNRLVLPATAIALLAQGLLHGDRFLESVAAGAGAALFFLLANIVSRNAVGMGDVKLVLLIGVVLGQDIVLALFLTGVAGAIAAIVLMVRGGLAARKQAIPYAPFLAVGAVAALLLGSSPLYS